MGQIQRKSVIVNEFAEGLGRLGFATGVLEAERPFLAPLHAFVGVHRHDALVRLPLFVMINLLWVGMRVRRRRAVECSLRRVHVGQLFRVDARAEGEEIAVGGWSPYVRHDGSISIKDSAWFSIRLTEETAPWAYVKGQPYKVIMSLEAIAALCGLMLLGNEALQVRGCPASSRAAASITGVGDSMGGTQAIAKGASSKFPLCVVLMELAVQQEARGLRLDAEWAPRYANEEADALSKGETKGFNPAMRMGGKGIEDMNFVVLENMMKMGTKFYEEIQEEKSRAAPHVRAPRRKRKRLKNKDPW